MNALNSNPVVTKVSPCFKTASGHRLGMTNNFYVKIDPVDISALVIYAQNNNVEILGKDPYMDAWYILSCTKNNAKNSLEYANQFHESGLFITAEPEFVYHDLLSSGAGDVSHAPNASTSLPLSNDPFFADQWGLKNTGQYGSQYAGIDINVEPAWAITKGSGVKVAIYDTGVELDHPDLEDNVFGTGFDIQSGTSPSQASVFEHGTLTAGIAGAIQNNNIGISGVAPESSITSISGIFSFSDTPSQLASGFNWAWQPENNVDIINCSWGGYMPSTIITDAIYNALNNGRDGKGCVVIFATGNEDSTNIRYPGLAVPEIITVGAISPCGGRAVRNRCNNFEFEGSNYGTQLDIMAPGLKISSTDFQGDEGRNPFIETNPLYQNAPDYFSSFWGTSAASPHVAGVAALILSVNPCLSNKQVSDIIEQSAQKVGNYEYTNADNRLNGTWNNEMGYGLVDAYAAVQLAEATNSSTLDLYVKDSPQDMGIEPNTITQYMWTSDDIWVRNTNDSELTHQNPEYDNGNDNFVKVRVINKSCVASSGSEQLELYWAKAATSLSWPNHWNGSLSVTNPAIPQSSFPLGGPLGTMNIPALQPGEETILTFAWPVPNPDDYEFINTEPWHFCLLSRIVSSVDLMTVPETTNVNTNTMNNNNIAWKNVTVISPNPTPSPNVEIGAVIAVGNPYNQTHGFFLEMVKENLETGKPIYEEAEVGLKMDQTLYDAWVLGGKMAQAVDSTANNKLKIVKGNNVLLDNLLFDANEFGTLYLSFNFLIKELTQKSNFRYHVIQKDATTGEVIGGETFVINKEQRVQFEAYAGGDKEVNLNQAITISADDINEPAIYNWYNASGSLIYEGKDLYIPNAIAEKYKLEVISTADGFKDYTEVEVKIKPSKINGITPNPAYSNITVSYQLNAASSAYLMILDFYGGNGTSNNYILDLNLNAISIDVSNYPNGYYTVALIVDGDILDTKTLIKQ